jgi:hypothetical protein
MRSPRRHLKVSECEKKFRAPLDKGVCGDYMYSMKQTTP